MPRFKVGIAQVDYTPPTGLPLMGNFRDEYGARGVHDPLSAKALVFEDAAGHKVALLCMDICVMDHSGVEMMRRLIASQTDIEPSSVLVAATHTHSGPAAVTFGSLPKADDAAIEDFLKRASQAVVLACGDLQESELAVGYAHEDRLSFNRRLRCKDGRTHMNWEGLEPDVVLEPLGPTDPQVIVVSVAQKDGSRAALVNFALHPAVLAGDNWLYSADYPGYLAEAMSKTQGTGFTTLFANGCCGNLNHIDYRDPTQGRGFQMTQRIGYMLAAASSQAIAARVSVRGHDIRVSSQRVPLKRLEVSEERRQWALQVLHAAAADPARGREDGLPDEHFAHLALHMHPLQHTDDPAEVMTLRIGDVAIVGLPAEMFCEFGLDIKRHSPAKHTLVIELANGWHGYVPTSESFDQGGYEVMPGSTFHPPGAGEALVASALDQLSCLFADT